jgi:RsiW-degrading membrane proteinase PrsW (M82 family)
MGTVPVVIIIELIGFMILGIFILIWLVGQSPDLLTQIQHLGESIANGNVGPDALLSTLQPYLEQPGVVLAGLLVLAVITPLVEEFFKPLALWFIPGRRLSEAEGFTLGLVAGGIFALLETLGSLSALTQRSELWLALVLTRTGTGLLHITCSGLTGWGLAAAWQNKRYMKYIGLYLLAVAIHGTWNFLAQLISLEGFMPADSAFSFIGRAAPFLMAGLAIVIFGGLVLVNRHLRSQQPVETQPPQAFALPMQPPGENYPPVPPNNE